MAAPRQFHAAVFSAVDEFARTSKDATCVQEDREDAAVVLGTSSDRKATTLQAYGAQIMPVLQAAINADVLREHKDHLGVIYCAGHGVSNTLAGRACPPLPPGPFTAWEAARECVDVKLTGGEWCLGVKGVRDEETPVCFFGATHFVAALLFHLREYDGQHKCPISPCHVVVVCDNCHAGGWIRGMEPFDAELKAMNVTLSIQAACGVDETNPGRVFAPAWKALNEYNDGEVVQLVDDFNHAKAAGTLAKDAQCIHPAWASYGVAPEKPNSKTNPIVAVGGVRYFADPAFLGFVLQHKGIAIADTGDRIQRRVAVQELRVEAIKTMQVGGTVRSQTHPVRCTCQWEAVFS